jgi:uncharacterized ferredoxin-like protein
MYIHLNGRKKTIMPIIFEEKIREKTIVEAANQIMIAARTAPKAKGMDNLVIAKIDKEQILQVADKMKELVSNKEAAEFFLRDADTILKTECVLLIGTRIKPLGSPHCGLCGFKNCEEKNTFPNVPCHFNVVDLGIAIGSAVGKASDLRIDNRVMRSVGMATGFLKLLGEDVKIIYGIPLSVSSKSPFFDR